MTVSISFCYYFVICFHGKQTSQRLNRPGTITTIIIFYEMKMFDHDSKHLLESQFVIKFSLRARA